MNKDKIFMVTIHVVAGVLMMAVCWSPLIVGNISVWNKFFCTVAIVLLLRFQNLLGRINFSIFNLGKIPIVCQSKQFI